MKQRSFFLLLLCFVIVTSAVTSVSAEGQCMNSGIYNSNSTFEANLRLILSFLPSNVTAQDDFFYSGSIGEEPNQKVYATGMCIPGSTSGQCSVCIKTASDDLLQSCPGQVEAYKWTSEPTLCLVRYSDASFLGSLDPDGNNLVYNPGDVNSNLIEFKAIWDDLVVRMIAAASRAKSTPSSSSNHYTIDAAALTPSQNLYALMQCTPDLSSRDCEICLQHQSCCGQRQGGVIMKPNCYFRWDVYAFYKAFDNISVASLPPPPSDNGGRKISTRVTVAIVVPIIVIIIIIIIILVLLIRRSALLCWRRKTYQKFDISQSGISAVRSLQFDFKAIEVATDKFSNKLGQGGFGEVFKGTLPNGTEIAVKRLSKTSSQGALEFKNEVVVVAKLQHKNLVRLHGFCLEGEEKILVYEFVPNKSLDYFLFDPLRKNVLDWRMRFRIMEGIIQGLLYLHKYSRLKVIHRDIKASNILLDEDMNPKISDFGMARIFGAQESKANTKRVAGTFELYVSGVLQRRAILG
uniref:Cysteine-rich receptor-like protein kinase 11 n=1 Tax=Noccaea caerulescens TaxID=107243 RepID=A0A1J3HF00_NOCCA